MQAIGQTEVQQHAQIEAHKVEQIDAQKEAHTRSQREAQREAQREVRDAQRKDAASQALEEQKRLNRATLLRDFENTTLTAANFSALKGITVAAMEGYLATARLEAQARRAAAPSGAPREFANAPAHQRLHAPRDERSRPDGRPGSGGRANRTAREPQR